MRLMAIKPAFLIAFSFFALSLLFSCDTGSKINQVMEKADRTKARSDLKMIVDTANMWKAMKGHYPKSLEVMISGVDSDGNKVVSIEIGQDPWGNAYQYKIVDEVPVATSLGKDGKAGGTGQDADLVHPDPEEEGY